MQKYGCLDMRIRIQLTLLLILLLIKPYAQQCDTTGFSIVYWFKNLQSSIIIKILPGPGGTTLLFGNMQFDFGKPTQRLSTYISKLNKKGTPLQTKVLKYDHDVYINDASQSTDGNYFITGFTNGTEGTDAWVAKVTADGEVLWSFGLGKPVGTFFKVTATANGGCLVAGRYAVQNTKNQYGDIIRAFNHAIIFNLDNTGKVIWGSEYYTAEEVEQVYEMLPMSDGSVVVSGAKNNSPDLPPGSDYFIMKLNSADGTVAWQKQSSVYLGQITEGGDGNLVFRQSNFLYFVNASNGTMIDARIFNFPDAYNGDFDMHYAGTFSDKKDLYYNFVDKKDVLLFELANYDTVAWVTDWQSANSFGAASNPFSVLLKPNGEHSIYIGGGLTTHSLSIANDQFTEQNSFLLRTDLSGNSPCTKILQLPVKFKQVDLPALDDFKWQGTDGMTFRTKRTLTAEILFPQSEEECYVNNCCIDTTININATVCNGGSYTLPNGKVVNTPGYYSALLKRTTGCDSIVFITLTNSALAKPTLGSDTCFVGSGPITLKLTNSQGGTYRWQDGSADSLYTASQPGIYTVQVTNKCGVNADTVVIYPDCNTAMFIPNAFTPNGDGKNDVFKIAGMQGQRLIDMSVYNRWGQLVFKTGDALKGWDGTINGKLPGSQTFVYMVRYINLEGKAKFIRGTISLIR